MCLIKHPARQRESELGQRFSLRASAAAVEAAAGGGGGRLVKESCAQCVPAGLNSGIIVTTNLIS